MKKADVKSSEAAALLDRIKILAVQAMFSDDELLGAATPWPWCIKSAPAPQLTWTFH